MSAAIEIVQGDWNTLGEAAGAIRRRVFIDEQQVSQDDEWDGRDPDCLHFLARIGARPVGTARLLPDGHIGRVAVLFDQRGRGIGLALMAAAIDAARRRGLEHVELAAQLHAQPFYERLGFCACGEAFMEAGIVHRNMKLHFTD